MPYNNNNNFQKNTVSTNSFTLFNNESDMLKLSFLDENFSISFCKPVQSMDGKSTYPSESRKYCVITPTTARSLLYKIDSYWMREAIDRFKAQSSGMPVEDKAVTAYVINKNATYVLELYYKDMSETGEFRPELRFYENIDPATHTPKGVEVYRFATNQSITSYDPETGDYTPSSEYIQLLLFCDCLREFTTVMSRATAHAYRYVSNYKNLEMTRLIREIAERNGINTGYNNNGGAPGSYAQARPTAPAPTSQQDLNALFGSNPNTGDLPF